MVLIFPDKASADLKLKELAVTPFGAVILWAGNPSPDFMFDADVNVISYLEGADGRVAMCHQFGEEDADWLEAQGVTVLDEIPEDWVYKTEIVPVIQS